MDVHDMTITMAFILQRVQKRKEWHTRQTDPIFRKLSPEFHPLDPPLPPYDPTAEEGVVVPCQADGTVYVRDMNEKKRALTQDVSVLPVNITRVIEGKLILKWQSLFEARA